MDRRDDARDHRLCDPRDDRRRSPLERASSTSEYLVGVADRLLSAERTIAAHFPDGRCVNVSWSILLALYAGRCDERKLDISAVCFAVPAPTTTVLRRIDRLQGLGLIERVPDRTDGRRTFIVLRPDALGRTEACLQAIGRQG